MLTIVCNYNLCFIFYNKCLFNNFAIFNINNWVFNLNALKVLNMSFFINLTSNQSDHIYPNNIPSDFYAELYEPLELEEEWEVALADISYCGQKFPNIKRKDGLVTLRLPGKRKMGEIVVTYMQSVNMYITVEAMFRKALGETNEYNVLGEIYLRNSHYTWDDFKDELVKSAERYNTQLSNKLDSVTMWIDDKIMKIQVNSINYSAYKFTFSQELKKILGININELVVLASLKGEFEILDIKTPKSYDFCDNNEANLCTPPLKNILLLSPYSKGAHWINVNGQGVSIPSKQFWNWHLLSEYCNEQFKNILYPGLKLSLDGNEYKFFVENTNEHVIHLEFSESLQKALSVPYLIKLPPTTLSTIILKPKLAPEDVTVDYITESDYLPSIQYDDLKVLLNDLNTTIIRLNVNLKNKREENNNEIVAGSLFQLKEDQKFELKIGEATIKLSQKLTNMLNLNTDDDEWLITSQISTKPILLEEYIPPYFFLYADFIETVGPNNYLRVINNVAKYGEHVQVSFPSFYYYRINKSFINTIRISLTDLEGDNLNLSELVILILHFRKCRSM